MRTDSAHAPLTVAGIAIRTSNREADETIPPHWGAFFAGGGIGQIPSRLDDEVIAVYTAFENEGVDNDGDYTLVIGCRVPEGSPTPEGLSTVTVPASDRLVFPVQTGRPDLVGDAWQRIWALTDLQKTYVADFERYSPDGDIEISIGVRSPE